MTKESDHNHDGNRRDFLTGKGAQKEIERRGHAIADEIAKDQGPSRPVGGNTIRLSARAMACEFSVVMNQGASESLMTAADALEIVHALEDQMTVYRDDSELSRLNRLAYENAIPVESGLFDLLKRARDISERTGGAFDPTSGSLIALWRRCRDDGRVPHDSEVADSLKHVGMQHIRFHDEKTAIEFLDPLVDLNLGAIGKGHALDEAGRFLQEQGIEDFLLHGGFSSLLARGEHQNQGGWPVGIRDPLLPHELMGTILLRDQALATSGSGVQSFRIDGKKYGHILDPRSGQPVEGLLSATVLAPTAAEADALSTAFFVLGLEKAIEYCDNNPNVSSLLIPPPHRGRQLAPVNCGLPDDVLFLDIHSPLTS